MERKTINSYLVFGRKIKVLRERMGWTQEELRKRAGFKSSGTVSQAEKGTCGMSQESKEKLAEIFGIHPIVLMTNREYSDQDLIDMVDFFEMLHNNPSNENRPAIRALIRNSKNKAE